MISTFMKTKTCENNNLLTDTIIFSHLLDSLNDIIIFLNSKKEVIQFNPAAEHYFGWKKSNVIGKDFVDLCGSNNFEYPALGNYFKTEDEVKNISQITQIRLMSGEKKSISWKVVPLKKNCQKILAYSLIGKDITSERNAEGDVKNIEKRLESVIESIAGNHWWKDVNGRYLGCNDAVARLLGFQSPSEIIGKTDYDLPWADVADHLIKHDTEVMRSGKAKEMEERVPAKDGGMLTFLVTKVPMRNKDGKIIGTLGTSVDITDQKNTLFELTNAKEKTERAIKAIKVFASSMAHELRTPLTSISGYTDGIIKHLPILTDAYQQAKDAKMPVLKIRANHFQLLLNASEIINAETSYANAMIDMLLIKVDSPAIKSAEHKLCSISECIKKAIFRYPFKSKEQAALINWQENKDFLFMGNELLTIHVFFNLIKNALYQIEAINKGMIFISNDIIPEGNLVHFKDTSKGISKQILPKIFDLYFSDKTCGVGIGLAFCKQVMESFSGNIACESEEGRYTHFILKFAKG